MLISVTRQFNRIKATMKYFLIIVAVLIVIAASRPTDDTQEESANGLNVRTDGDLDSAILNEDNSENNSKQQLASGEDSLEDQTSNEQAANETQLHDDVSLGKPSTTSSEQASPYENSENSSQPKPKPEDKFIIFTINETDGIQLYVNNVSDFVTKFLRPFTQFRI